MWMNTVQYQRTIWWIVLGLVVVVTGGPSLFTHTASAQSWLPWSTPNERPRRRPPPRRDPPPNYGQFRQPGTAPGSYTDSRSPICLQLEQRLALDAQNQAGARGALQQLRADLSAARGAQRRAERELERRNCYETFLFTRSLRPSRVCHRLDRNSRAATRQVRFVGRSCFHVLTNLINVSDTLSRSGLCRRRVLFVHPALSRDLRVAELHHDDCNEGQ